MPINDLFKSQMLSNDCRRFETPSLVDSLTTMLYLSGEQGVPQADLQSAKHTVPSRSGLPIEQMVGSLTRGAQRNGLPTSYQPDSVATQKSNLAATLGTLNSLDKNIDFANRKNAIKNVLLRASVLDSADQLGYGARLQKLDEIIGRVNDAKTRLNADENNLKTVKTELKHHNQLKNIDGLMTLLSANSRLNAPVASVVDEWKDHCTVDGTIAQLDLTKKYSSFTHVRDSVTFTLADVKGVFVGAKLVVEGNQFVVDSILSRT